MMVKVKDRLLRLNSNSCKYLYATLQKNANKVSPFTHAQPEQAKLIV